jgi:hypothetical protein
MKNSREVPKGKIHLTIASNGIKQRGGTLEYNLPSLNDGFISTEDVFPESPVKVTKKGLTEVLELAAVGLVQALIRSLDEDGEFKE